MKEKVFIHILWHDELKFTTRLIDFFNDKDVALVKSTHIFVTPYYNVYMSLRKHGNIEYYPLNRPRSSRIINHFAPKCDYLVLHNICDSLAFFGIRRKYLKKIIWRTWGWDRLGAIPYTRGRLSVLGVFLKYITNHYVINCVNHFAGIGISNNVDKIEIRRKFSKDIPLFRMPYPNKLIDNTFLSNLKKSQKNEFINVLVGHSGFKDDNHIEILKQLEKFKDNNINVNLILSYGNDDYIKTVKQYVKKNWKSKIKIIEDFLPYQQYLDLLNTMDIAIFDGTYSYALGNIAILLYLKKKIFLNRNGVIAEAFKAEHIPFRYTDSISNMTFSDFSKPIVYDSDSWKKLSIHTYDQCIEEWNDVIKYYANK